MADFKTHIAVGVVASGMLSTLTMAAAIVSAEDLITLAICGAIGSVLPDIDLQNSRASQAMFSGLGLVLAFSVLFRYSWKYSIAEMWILWVGIFLAVRFLGHNIFHKYTVHRGVFHSILSGAFFAFLTAALLRYFFASDVTLSWLAGSFVLVGYLVHLTLDEIYSVDFHGNRVRRSFGTALKLFDHHHPYTSLTMGAAAVLAFLAAPPVGPFATIVGSPAIWAFLSERMLPEENWFGFITSAAGRLAALM